MRVNDLAQFIVEREHVRENKHSGARKPWTNDPILQHYRFCNVHREHDTVTQYIETLWRHPYRADEDLWFLMAVARWVNWPGTLHELDIRGAVTAGVASHKISWNPRLFIKILKERAQKGEKVWTGAYMIGTQGNAKDKPIFIAEDVLTPLWENRKHLRPRKTDLLEDFAQRIIAVKNQGKFMVGQIVADLKYAQLLTAEDWMTFAVSGPGSRRGLNRVVERDKDAPWKEKEWKDTLLDLQTQVNRKIERTVGPLHAQDLQNCLCEFDKYERVRLGEGRPRSLYPGVS